MNFTRRLAEDARKNSSDPRIRAQADAYCRNADRAAKARIQNRKHRKERLGVATLHHEAFTAAKEKSAAERRREVRASVVKRAGGQCECIAATMGIRCGNAAHEWDHFWGRKDKRQETAEGTWMLCTNCHVSKTRNSPDRVWWLIAFRHHAARHQYVAQEQKVTAAIALEHAQHPAASRSGAEGDGR